MKRIFFYANIHVADKSSGITKKVMLQIKTMKQMGFEVYYTGYTSSGVAIFDNNENIVLSNKFSLSNSSVGKILRRKKLIELSKEYISNAPITFDYAYSRFHFFDKYYYNFLKEIKNKNIYSIVEAHCYPYRQFCLNKKSFLYLKDFIYQSKCSKKIDLVAAISAENNIWGCKTISIDNCIDIDDFESLNKKFNKTNGFNLIAVSIERKAQSYYKVVKGLNLYYKNGGQRDVNIFFIGDYLKNTKKLVKKYKLSDRVIFTGRLYSEKLNEYYNKSDIGLGAFALYHGSTSGSLIKTKEYFAYGLPHIHSWKEYNCDENYKYVMKVNPCDKYIDFFDIEKFYDGLCNDENISMDMRDFARVKYQWGNFFDKIFDI